MLRENENGGIRPLEDDDQTPRLPKYERWNLTSAYCYRRGCRCGENAEHPECPMLKYCTKPYARFVIKHVVIKLVRELGAHRIENDLREAIKEPDYDASFDS